MTKRFGFTNNVILNLIQDLSMLIRKSPNGKTLIDSGSESGMTQNCHAELVSASIHSVDEGSPLTPTLSRRARGNKAAFTLAEVLITLAIIGVVATMTIPTLVAEYNQKSWDTATSVFNRRLGEALKIMNASGTLANHDTTAEFVEELSKHIKIVKTCDKGSLDDCFVSEISTTAEPVETSKLQSAKNLNSAEDYGTDTMGVMFGDGTSALIAYNKNTPYDPYSNKIVELTRGDDGKSVGLSTKAISILYDVNGLKSPNQMDAGKDIRGINVAIKTGAPIKVIGTDYTAVDCTDSSGADYKYCAPTSSGYSNDHWAGAKKACAELGMSLPTVGSYAGSNGSWYCESDAAENTLCGLYNNREALGLPTSGWFWSASENFAYGSWFVHFSNGDVFIQSKDYKENVVCVSN